MPAMPSGSRAEPFPGKPARHRPVEDDEAGAPQQNESVGGNLTIAKDRTSTRKNATAMSAATSADTRPASTTML